MAPLSAPITRNRVDLTKLSPFKLKSLSDGRTVTVSGFTKTSPRPWQILEPVPIAALVMFSGRAWEEIMVKNQKASELLVEGMPGALGMIMQWMIACCKEGKISPLTVTMQPALTFTLNLLELAKTLDMPIIKPHLDAQMDAILADQVHWYCCQQIFTSEEPEFKCLRKKVGHSNAIAMYENRLRDLTRHSELRAEIPHYNDAVYAVFTPMREAWWRKRWALEKQAAQRALLKKEQMEKRMMRWNKGGQYHSDAVSVPETITEEEEEADEH